MQSVCKSSSQLTDGAKILNTRRYAYVMPAEECTT